eukprot:PhF_6_TR10807/c0_g1_i4/m.17408
MPPKEKRETRHVTIKQRVLKNPNAFCYDFQPFDDHRSLYAEITLGDIVMPADVVGCIVAADWADQGWGNRKGRIGFRGRRHNLFSEFAEHARGVNTGAHDDIIAKKGDTIDVVYEVGGGGGHTLTVHRLSICFFNRAFFLGELYNWLFTFKRIRDVDPRTIPEPNSERRFVFSISKCPWDVVACVASYLVSSEFRKCSDIKDISGFLGWK